MCWQCSDRMVAFVSHSHYFSLIFYKFCNHRYLRLGDDMSQYGSAFLSLDAGVTYLDDGATSIVNTSSTPGG